MARGASLRVVVVKPDWGVRGGAEVVVERMEAVLRGDGHRVEHRTLAVHALPRTPFRVGLPERAWNAVPELFRYLAILEAVERLDVRGADLVVSTHAPSFAVDHPRHLSLFFHHLRVFYDLDDVFVASGLAGDGDLHSAARDRVRALDQPRLERVAWFSPNSEVTAARLVRFNGLSNATVHHAGSDAAGRLGCSGYTAGRERVQAGSGSLPPGRGAVLCVGRSEFSKRTELFVAAMHLLTGRSAVLAGAGGRWPFVVHLDRRLAAEMIEPATLTDADLWLNRGEVPAGPRWRRTTGLAGLVDRRLSPASNVALPGRVDDHTLARLYRQAPCVVAPAYGEDYGLTAVEAMAHGKPVVVCADGGGLTTIVEHEVDGLVVEPSPSAVAAAVQRIVDDRDLAHRLGKAALAKAATFTWERTADELRQSVERVMS